MSVSVFFLKDFITDIFSRYENFEFSRWNNNFLHKVNTHKKIQLLYLFSITNNIQFLSLFYASFKHLLIPLTKNYFISLFTLLDYISSYFYLFDLHILNIKVFFSAIPCVLFIWFRFFSKVVFIYMINVIFVAIKAVSCFYLSRYRYFYKQ